MMFTTAALFLGGVIVDIFLLMKVHRIYRLAGASLQKAQGEFATGVASNPHVQSAATNAAAAGVRSAMTNQKWAVLEVEESRINTCLKKCIITGSVWMCFALALLIMYFWNIFFSHYMYRTFFFYFVRETWILWLVFFNYTLK